MAAQVRIAFGTSVRMWFQDMPLTVVRGRKAHALLALVGLSPSASLSRQTIAATLWSDSERTPALARLRDVLHDLRRALSGAGLDVIELDGDTVRLRPGAVQVEVDDAAVEAMPGADRWSKFLCDLEGMGSALDRWLTLIRAEQRRKDSSPPLIQPVPSSDTPEQGRPTVVVTEFVGVGLDASLAAVLTDEVGAGLARLRWFDTVTHTVQGTRLTTGTTDLSQIGDYALVGTVRSDVTQHRLLLKLIDLRDRGAIRWSSSFEQDCRHGLGVGERFANAVAARLDTELLLIEVGRQRARPPSLREGAYALVLQAVPGIYRLERTPFLQVGHILDQAVMIDPESAFAHSWLAFWHVFLVGQGWARNPYQAMMRAGQASERAIMLDPKDARGVTIAGHVKAFLHRRLEEASALHELAIQLNPAMALAWHFAGMTHAYAGRLDQAYDDISHSRMLAPTDPLGFFAEGALGIVHLLQHDHERAASLGRRVTERHPNFTSALKSYLAALGHLGQQGEASRVLRRLLALEPQFSLHRFRKTAPYQRARDLEHFTAGLRLAGVD